MEKLWMCRICLTEDIQMHLIADTHLQNVYEALTSKLLETEDNRPILACYICHARLQNCYQLKMRCLKSEELLTEMLVKNTLDPKHRPITRRLEIVHPVVQLSLSDVVEKDVEETEITVIELPEISVDVKVEHESGMDDITIEENDIRTGLPVAKNKATVTTDENTEDNGVCIDMTTEEDIVMTTVENNALRNDVTLEEQDIRPDITVQKQDQQSDVTQNGHDNGPELTLQEKDKLTDALLEKQGKQLEETQKGKNEGSKVTLQEKSKHSDITLEEKDKRSDVTIEENDEMINVSLEERARRFGVPLQDKFKISNLTLVGKDRQIKVVLENTDQRKDINPKDTYKITNVNIVNNNTITELNKTSTNLTVLESEKRLTESEMGSMITTNVATDEKSISIDGRIPVETNTKPSSDQNKTPKVLKVLLERISPDSIKTRVAVREKPTLVPRREYSQDGAPRKTKSNKERHHKTNHITKLSKENIIKSILKHNRTSEINPDKKHIKKRVSFSDIDKENIAKTITPQSTVKKKPYQCDICKKFYTLKHNIRMHVRTHFEEKRYKCDQCNRQFHRRNAYVLHYRTHTDDKPFQCEVCKKRFPRKFCYERHLIVHSGPKPHKCNVCDKSFFFYDNLNQHLRIHTGYKPYKCEVCDKAFADRRSMLLHTRVHTGDEPYKCDVCNKYYHNTETLFEHFRKHSDKKPCQCEYCKRYFIFYKNCIKHIKKKHKKKNSKKLST